MKRERWDAPAPDGESPEAEWGFEETLRADVEQLAAARGHRVVRIVFDEPEDPSPLVAELYRWWYRARGIPANRLLVDSFIIMDPWWTLRLGAVPSGWFNTEGSAAAVERHLDEAAPYDEIHLMLFAHGVDSIGLADRALAQPAGAGKAVRPLRRRGREGLPGGFRRVRPLPPRAAPDSWRHPLPARALFWVSPAGRLKELFDHLHDLTDIEEAMRLSALHEVDFVR